MEDNDPLKPPLPAIVLPVAPAAFTVASAVLTTVPAVDLTPLSIPPPDVREPADAIVFRAPPAIAPSSSAAIVCPQVSAQQRAPEQRYTQWFANRQKVQAQAKRIYEAEMAREKAGDCPNASTTRDFEECYSKVLQTAEGSLKDFESSIRAWMTNPPDSSSAKDNLPGPAGPHLTLAQRSAEFEQVEHLWHDYQNSACAAAFHQYDGGTGVPPGELECEIRLVRNHLRELDLIYGIGLRLWSRFSTSAPVNQSQQLL